MKTKEKILYATLDLADKEGLGRISMSDIATAIGIKKPSLYNHYTSKKELMRTMFTHIRSEALKKMPNDNMEAYVERFPSEAILYHAIDVYYKWNQESDVICDSTPPLLPTSHPDILKFTPWAYSLNTATGFYRKSINKDFLNDDNLLKINLETTIEVFSNVSVCPHKYYDKFMIVIFSKIIAQ